jgi:DUF4097 and DUF4098 domain-containing protein YvlB
MDNLPGLLYNRCDNSNSVGHLVITQTSSPGARRWESQSGRPLWLGFYAIAIRRHVAETAFKLTNCDHPARNRLPAVARKEQKMKTHVLGILLILALLLVACDGLGSQKYSETLEESFAVGEAPILTVDNFAGEVTVRAGEGDSVRVVATKRAAREKDLDDIQVRMNERDGAVEIITDRPSGLKNLSVELEITAPAVTRVDVRTGGGDVNVRGIEGRTEANTGGGRIEVRDASGDLKLETGGGSIEVRDARGTVEARTGGGNIEVRDATGLARLETGGGGIDYEGQPQGNCLFETGGGSIKLRLPADISVRVDLDTGGGKIDVDFSVDGRVSKQEVNGIIGSGDEAEIRAHTGGGDINVIRQ